MRTVIIVLLVLALIVLYRLVEAHVEQGAVLTTQHAPVPGLDDLDAANDEHVRFTTHPRYTTHESPSQENQHEHD